jgi:kumamolisin
MGDDRVSFERRVLPGSDRSPAPDVRPAGELDLEARAEVTVVLRRRAPIPEGDRAQQVGREEFAEAYGADPADVTLTREILTGFGLDIVSIDLGSRRIRVAGTVGQLANAFGASLERVESVHPNAGEPVAHRHRTGPLHLPAELDGIVVAVLGLDDRPQARAYVRAVEPAAVSTSYTPLELGTVYDFPADTDGSGQTLAIIELGGGFDQADLDAYFGGLGIATPSVEAVSIDGAQNVPGQDPNGADGEVLLDIEVAGALAPQAKILVYFAPNTDAGFLDAVSTAAHADPTPSAMSISWGQSEDAWTPQARTALDDAMADAVLLGVTVTAAAGDSGSSDEQGVTSSAHVDFPASSPNALACGGTTLNADASSGTINAETVWNDGSAGGATGGGVSDVFALPSWQSSAGVPARAGGNEPGRGVPDVAGDADPRTGYRVRVDGTDTVIGGTSAVAPLWAALACRIAQAAGKRLGLLQPTLYADAKPGAATNGFRDIVDGSNGAYQAAAGWDPCTGLGSPDGAALLTVVQPKG